MLCRVLKSNSIHCCRYTANQESVYIYMRTNDDQISRLPKAIAQLNTGTVRNPISRRPQVDCQGWSMGTFRGCGGSD